MIDGGICTGSTPTFRLDADKDGAIWDLDTPATATVKLYLTDPDGAQTEHTATLTNADAGIADYVVTVNDLDQAGTWYRQWEVTQGGVVIGAKRIAFQVEEGP